MRYLIWTLIIQLSLMLVSFSGFAHADEVTEEITTIGTPSRFSSNSNSGSVYVGPTIDGTIKAPQNNIVTSAKITVFELDHGADEACFVIHLPKGVGNPIVKAYVPKNEPNAAKFCSILALGYASESESPTTFTWVPNEPLVFLKGCTFSNPCKIIDVLYEFRAPMQP